MAELASKHIREVVQRRMQHPSSELEFGAFAALGLGGQPVGVGNRGWQGSPLRSFVEVIGFVERKQVYAH